MVPGFQFNDPPPSLLRRLPTVFPTLCALAFLVPSFFLSGVFRERLPHHHHHHHCHHYSPIASTHTHAPNLMLPQIRVTLCSPITSRTSTIHDAAPGSCYTCCHQHQVKANITTSPVQPKNVQAVPVSRSNVPIRLFCHDTWLSHWNGPRLTGLFLLRFGLHWHLHRDW